MPLFFLFFCWLSNQLTIHYCHSRPVRVGTFLISLRQRFVISPRALPHVDECGSFFLIYSKFSSIFTFTIALTKECNLKKSGLYKYISSINQQKVCFMLISSLIMNCFKVDQTKTWINFEDWNTILKVFNNFCLWHKAKVKTWSASFWNSLCYCRKSIYEENQTRPRLAER